MKAKFSGKPTSSSPRAWRLSSHQSSSAVKFASGYPGVLCSFAGQLQGSSTPREGQVGGNCRGGAPGLSSPRGVASGWLLSTPVGWIGTIFRLSRAAQAQRKSTIVVPQGLQSLAWLAVAAGFRSCFHFCESAKGGHRVRHCLTLPVFAPFSGPFDGGGG